MCNLHDFNVVSKFFSSINICFGGEHSYVDMYLSNLKKVDVNEKYVNGFWILYQNILHATDFLKKTL